MADGIYIGMAGAAARMSQLDSIADNLANAQSTGFKAERPAFESFLPPGNGTGPAAPAPVATALDMREGPHKSTGQPLDVVPENGAFLSVALRDGSVGYTRNGQLSIGAYNGTGDLLMTAGHPVLDTQGQTIQIPTGEKVDLSVQGILSVKGTPLAQLATYQLTGAIDRVAPTVLAPGVGGAATPDTGRIRVGELEVSNFQPMEGIVQMISAQRQYDSSLQAIETYKAMGTRAGQLGTVQQ